MQRGRTAARRHVEGTGRLGRREYAPVHLHGGAQPPARHRGDNHARESLGQHSDKWCVFRTGPRVLHNGSLILQHSRGGAHDNRSGDNSSLVSAQQKQAVQHAMKAIEQGGRATSAHIEATCARHQRTLRARNCRPRHKHAARHPLHNAPKKKLVRYSQQTQEMGAESSLLPQQVRERLLLMLLKN